MKRKGAKRRLFHETGCYALGGFDNLAGAQAGGTHADALNVSCHNSPYVMQVGQKTTAGRVMRMTDIIAGHRTFTTDFATLCHGIPRLKGGAL